MSECNIRGCYLVACGSVAVPGMHSRADVCVAHYLEVTGERHATDMMALPVVCPPAPACAGARAGSARDGAARGGRASRNRRPLCGYPTRAGRPCTNPVTHPASGPVRCWNHVGK